MLNYIFEKNNFLTEFSVKKHNEAVKSEILISIKIERILLIGGKFILLDNTTNKQRSNESKHTEIKSEESESD